MKTSPSQKIALRMTVVLCLAAMLFSFGIPAQAGTEAAAIIDSIDSFQQVSAGQGWILFSGQLYWTNNDGAAWTDITLDASARIEAVTFLNATRGWTVLSDTSGYLLASTTNGGTSWQIRALDLPALAHTDSPVAKVFMGWQTETHGWLSFKLATSSNFDRRLTFTTLDGGATWSDANVSGGVGSASGDQLGVQKEAGMVEMSMSSSESGWAKWQSGQCDGASCAREVKLLATSDGVHWNALRLPNGQISLQENFSITNKSFTADSDTKPYTGQGFDMCEITNLTQMQTWWNSSPYNAVNLYFGGISRACSNALITSSYLSQLHAQGWRFIPTWVGLQASCSGFNHKMSSDVTIAYNQGVAEADAAVAALQTLGLTNPDGSGSIAYFDLEGYDTSNANCRAAANSFISGWTFEMRAKGNLAGVYGASCASAPTDWWTVVTNVPDALWIANWYGNPGTVSYTRTASVWNAACLSNTLWPNQQRLRQYAGDHNETWGAVTLNIDSNVLDGPLTVPNGTGDAAAPGAPASPGPADASTLERANDTWLSWKTNGDTCSLHIWGGSLDTTVATNCSLYHLGPQAGGAYSWQVTATNGLGSTLGPVWRFGIKPNPPTGLTATSVSASRVNLNWTLSSDEPSVDSYAIYMNNAQIGTAAAGANTFPVLNLTCNTSYTFVVKTVRQGIESNASNTASATTASCAPVLVSPIGGVVVDSLQPVFVWEAVSGATYYQIQVSTSASFSTYAVNARPTATTYTSTINLLANKLYYWRVRAIGSFGTGDWASSTFNTPNPPPAPGLLSPTSNSVQTDTTPTFDWKDVVAPTGTTFDHYQIQVATDLVFTAPVVNENVTVSTFTPATDFLPNTKYYWRVRAANTLGHLGTWSATWNFRSAILPPNLVSPADGAHLLTRRPAFDWSDVTGASGYTLQISTVNTFSTVLKTVTATGSSITLTFDLPANSTLYWRVRANGTNGPSLYSAAWGFVTPNPPTVPILLSPLNGSQINDLTPLLAWRAVTVPAGTTFDHYQVQVALDTTFASPVIEATVTTLSPSQYTLVTPLLPGKKYYWRVMACNTAGECSAWSLVWSFKTSATATMAVPE